MKSPRSILILFLLTVGCTVTTDVIQHRPDEAFAEVRSVAVRLEADVPGSIHAKLSAALSDQGLEVVTEGADITIVYFEDRKSWSGAVYPGDDTRKESLLAFLWGHGELFSPSNEVAFAGQLSEFLRERAMSPPPNSSLQPTRARRSRLAAW